VKILQLSFIFFSSPIVAFTGSEISIPRTTQNVKYTSQELSDFIYNRTFCIAGNNDGSNLATSAGTGWLFKWDGGYKYEMFTNWHVSLGMERTVGYSYASSNENGTAIISSFNLLTNNANWHEASYYKNGNVQQGVDAAVMTVDFSGWVSHDAKLKSRLDDLNSYAPNHDDYLFNGVIDYDELSANTNYYVGGYPWTDSTGTISSDTGQWWCGSDYISSKVACFSTKSKDHEIDEQGKKISIANHYESITTDSDNTPMSKMGHGCSGSMIIDSNEHLIGLLWGGGGNSSYSVHSYEAFSWDDGKHNLYNDYKNGQWISKPVSNSTFIFLVATFSILAVSIALGFTIGYCIKKKNANKKL